MRPGVVRHTLFALMALGLVTSAWAQAVTYRFDLAQQPLADAIIRLSRIIGVNVLFESELLAGRESPSLKGEMTAAQAFDRLLADTGLVARQTDARSIYIQGIPASALAAAPEQQPAPEIRGDRFTVVMPNGVIEEIIVTAQMREESMQSLPVMVQVMTDYALQRAGIKDFGNINKVASNIQVVQGAGAPIIAIRGIRANSFGAASESPVAVHLNGNYISQAVSLSGMFFDLERVEILAGPQGTSFGRNAAAGVINILTRKPLSRFEAGGELEVGSDELRRATAVLNLPLNEDVAVRLAGQSLTRDGYFRNGLDDANQQSARVAMSWRSSESSQWLATADYSRNQPKGSSDNLIAAGNPGNGLAVPPLRDNGVLYGEAERASRDQEFWGAAVQYDRDFAPGTFTLQASHRDVYQIDQAYGAQNLTNPTEFGHSNTLEARLASPSGRPLEYVGGLYYFHENKHGGTGAYADLSSTVLPSQIRILGQETDAGAAFGQLNYSPLPPLHFALGLRYNYDYKRASSLVLAPPATSIFQPPESDHWSRLTWKGSVSYDLAPGNIMFATVSTGYKSGTFAYGPTPRIDPQDVTSYEIGSKNRFFDDRLQLNLNVYYSDYLSLEQPYSTPIPGTTLFLVSVTNTGGAIVSGADLEADWLATRQDRFRARINYLRARYRDFDLTPFGGLNYSGRSMSNTPPWAMNVGYTRSWRGWDGTLDFSIDAQYRSARGISAAGSYDAAGEPYLQDASTVLDLGLKYAPFSGRWSVTAYANNVLDEVYFTQANYNVQRGYNVYAQIAPPRTYGLILGLNF